MFSLILIITSCHLGLAISCHLDLATMYSDVK
jgi:hypothetical protein